MAVRSLLDVCDPRRLSVRTVGPEALRDGTFVGLLAHAESNMPEGRAIVSDLAAVELPIRMVGELLWALQDQVCVSARARVRAHIALDSRNRAQCTRSHMLSHARARAHTHTQSSTHAGADASASRGRGAGGASARYGP